MRETRKFDITIDDHRFIGEEEYGGQIYINQVFVENKENCPTFCKQPLGGISYIGFEALKTFLMSIVSEQFKCLLVPLLEVSCFICCASFQLCILPFIFFSVANMKTKNKCFLSFCIEWQGKDQNLVSIKFLSKFKLQASILHHCFVYFIKTC